MSIINLISRKSEVYIGGKLFPFESITLSDSAWDESGQITCAGRITLKTIPGFDESLDDRINTRFWEGQEIEIWTEDASGTLLKHPRGQLRILTASYEAPTLTLEVGCEIAYGQRNEPTDPDEAEITLGSFRAIADVAATLARKAGIGPAVDGGVAAYSVNCPIDIGGSYIATMGKLLYSLNAIAWSDSSGSIRFDPVQSTAPAFTLQVGTTAKPPTRLNDPERPPEIVRVVGNGVVVKPTSESDSYTLESYVEGKLFRKLTITTTLAANKKTRVTVEEEKLEGILNGLEVEDIYNMDKLWTKEEKTETWTYESGDSGKLLKSSKEVYRPLALACRSFVAWHKSNDTAYWNGEGFAPALKRDLLGSVLAESEATSYTYSLQEETKSIFTETSLTESEILGATAIDWQAWIEGGLGRPSSLRKAAEFSQRWNEIRKGQWEKIESQKESTASRDPKRYDDAEVSELLQTGFTLSASDDEIRESNSGQEQPPAPERRIPRFVAEQYPVEEEALFPQLGGSHNPRMRSFQIPYLQGKVGSDTPRANAGRVTLAGSGDITGAKLQAQQLAQLHGQILIGRHRGDRIDLPLIDELFTEYIPLMTVDVAHGDITRRYLMDATTWVITPTQTIVSFDGIWLGTVADGELIPPYKPVRQMRGGWRWGGNLDLSVNDSADPVALRSGWRWGGSIAVQEEEEIVVAGYMICTGECSAGNGGKAVAFPVESYGTYTFAVVPEGLNITTAADAIEVHRWSQLPNTDLDGREWVADIPQTGGTFSVTIDSTYQWISVFARNPDNGDTHDGVCFLWSGNSAMLMGFI